ncbi:MAG TPA: zinc ribbon domain-containing protein [Gemmatimonadaceae bacterium]|nr:zinc ribbon domain-containing protein [Gemmatimonadaceae bacterium]
MPTYDFRCAAGHVFERFYRTISASPGETECPQCGQLATRLVSAGAGLLFKGSGFYITDYGKDGKKDQRQSGATGDGAKSAASSSPSNGAAPKADAPKADAPKSTPAKPAGGGE